VKFREFVRDIQAHLKKSSIDRRTRQRLRSYYASGQVKFPRIFGYRQTPNGIEIVEGEGRIIRLVLGMLADGRTIPDVKRHLDSMNLRGRSGNLFTLRDIAAMAKPIYCGRVQTPPGRWVKSAFYAPIVSAELLKNAQRALRGVTEGADFGLPVLDGGVFLTSNALG
jgi:hypothetical protein